MKSAVATVPVRELSDLALAVDRLDWLCAECRRRPEHIDPTSLFDALSDVYVASRSLVLHTAVAPKAARVTKGSVGRLTRGR